MGHNLTHISDRDVNEHQLRDAITDTVFGPDLVTVGPNNHGAGDVTIGTREWYDTDTPGTGPAGYLVWIYGQDARAPLLTTNDDLDLDTEEVVTFVLNYIKEHPFNG